MKRAVCSVCPWRGEPDEAWAHEIRHWVEESCAAQGIPVHVQDPEVIKKVLVLFGFSV